MVVSWRSNARFYRVHNETKFVERSAAQGVRFVASAHHR